MLNRSCQLVIALLASATIAGCSTTPLIDCADADWYTAGQRDAMNGQPRQSEAGLNAVCPGVSPDFARYDDGWFDGQVLYCTRTTALRIGRAGGRFVQICNERNGQLREAYNVGAGLYRISRSLTNVRLMLESTRSTLRDSTITQAQRSEMLRRLSYLQGSEATLNAEKAALEREASLIKAAETTGN